MNDRHDYYDGDAVRYVDADGKSVKADEEWFADLVGHYEHAGVDPDLIYMARPLLEGTASQKQAAEKFFGDLNRNAWNSHDAQIELLGVLHRAGASMGRSAPRATSADLMKKWDESSPGGKGSGDFTLGTSKEAERNGFAQGGYSSGAGAKSKSGPSGSGVVANFSD